jgi:hypothetical protein
MQLLAKSRETICANPFVILAVLIVSGHRVAFGKNSIRSILGKLHHATSAVIVIATSTSLQVRLPAKRSTV